jgi:hypothetical protein
MHPDDLETLVDGELRQLPLPRAPHTLLPRVLAAVQQWTRRPWYARAWVTWPRAWQVVSIAALILFGVGSAMLLPAARAAASGPASTFAAGVVSDVAGMAQGAEATMTAARVLWRTLLEPFVAYAFAVVLGMCLACAALGTALNHVVLGRAFQR